MNTPKLNISIVEQTKTFVDAFKSAFPSFPSFKKWIIGVIIMTELLIMGCILFPYLIRETVQKTHQSLIELKKLKHTVEKDNRHPCSLN
jgi:hypothetical protein